ncbi:hypothetical protein FRB99_008838 [Tulasnella sp. 403]|nr:hypothetical protein FRB99_008838 [Tulasnella sp. 403]
MHCPLCNVVGMKGKDFQAHLDGQRHLANALRIALDGTTVPAPVQVDPPNTTRCDICLKDILTTHWTRHLTTPQHVRKQHWANFTRILEQGKKDKNGVTVSPAGGLDFGIVEPDDLRRRPVVEAKMSLKVERGGNISLVEARMSSAVGRYAHLRTVNFTPRLTAPVKLKPGTTHVLTVSFDPLGNTGIYDDKIELVFDDARGQTRFAIIRTVKAIVGVRAEQELLAPSAPYVPPQPRLKEVETNVVEGIKPPALAKIVWAKPLPPAEVPQSITEMAEGSTGEVVRKFVRMLPQMVDVETYGRQKKTLLWLEEVQATKDMRNYDQEGMELLSNKDGTYYHRMPYRFSVCSSRLLTTPFLVSVPGLAEKRPSVIIGDTIRVREHGRTNGPWYRGHVHNVEEKQVTLRFASSFYSIRRQTYDVRFELGRLPLRRMHQAVESAFTEGRVLFPTRTDILRVKVAKPTAARLNSHVPFDRLVGTNPPQWLATIAIAELKPGSVPFVVFGPPGTGKTVTIIESIRQVLSHQSSARILACAPSNSAADILAERLSRHVPKSQLFRLNAPSRLRSTLPRELEDFSLVDNKEMFAVPSARDLMKYRVVVSTCLSASVVYGIGVPAGHFGYIFVDEAGQATEPEAMVPIKLNAGPRTNVILAGDPKQLGPIVRSPVAQKLGLSMSYLERLMSLPLYDPVAYNGVTVVKLTKNWRSHPAILRYPNEEFYRDELEACGDPVMINSLLRWNYLPSSTFPIIFHSIKGKDQREASSPSFFNIDEASAVRKYVADLKGDTRLRLTDKDIGIISPYHAQCQKIRTLLRVQHPGIKVGSVEEFQGQERRIIIVSTVRSSMEYIEFDVRHTLGFVSNPRRFNVAVTRAKALLIVVGDPDVLGLDPLWRSFLNYIHNNGGWTGRRVGWDTMEPVERANLARTERRPETYDARRREEMETEMDELVARTRAIVLDNLLLDDEDLEDAEVGRIEAAVDMPWREDE